MGLIDDVRRLRDRVVIRSGDVIVVRAAEGPGEVPGSIVPTPTGCMLYAPGEFAESPLEGLTQAQRAEIRPLDRVIVVRVMAGGLAAPAEPENETDGL
jgi:hypothetical protein